MCSHCSDGYHTTDNISPSQALFGKLLFGEALALLWWLGASVILFGLVMINYGSAEQSTEQTDKKER